MAETLSDEKAQAARNRAVILATMSRLGRALCIEDDADVLTVLSFALQRHGAEAVETATDGASGIAKARSACS